MGVLFWQLVTDWLVVVVEGEGEALAGRAAFLHSKHSRFLAA